jgi:hypothetical protein
MVPRIAGDPAQKNERVSPILSAKEDRIATIFLSAAISEG